MHPPPTLPFISPVGSFHMLIYRRTIYIVTWGSTVGTLKPGSVCGEDSVARGRFTLSPGQGLGYVRCRVPRENVQFTSELWTSRTG